MNKKPTLNIPKHKKHEDNSDSSFLYEEKKLNYILSSNSEEKLNIKDKQKKPKYINITKIYKEDSNNNSNNNINNYFILNNGLIKKVKDKKNYKKNINNILNNNSKYIVKHENEIFVENNLNKKEKSIIKIHEFSIIQPEKLIYFEYNKANERPNNKNNIINKKAEETLNYINIRNKNKNNGNNINEESMEKKIKIKKKSVFCCL